MNSQQFGLIFYETVKDLETTLVAKANDYATEDVLSNFKRLSNAAKALDINVQTPVGYSLFMSLMKLDRINNLTKVEKETKFESVEDSFKDLLGYVMLAHAIFLEKDAEYENL